jgi:hypothetical protein
MITEQELLDAINSCLKDPVSYSNCEKLANFFVIHDHLYGHKTESASSRERVEIIRTSGTSDFLKAADGMEIKKFLAVMDELLTKTIKVINPRLYDGVMQKLDE